MAVSRLTCRSVRPPRKNPRTPSSTQQPSALGPQPAATGGLGGTLFGAFIGGLILNLMPCVFPVPGHKKFMGFVNQAGNHQTSRIDPTWPGFRLAGVLVAVLGSPLACVLILPRSADRNSDGVFNCQSPAFVFAMASFLLIFAPQYERALPEIGLSATASTGASLQMQDGFVGSFFTGALATLVATPCSAPFLAPALGAALTLSPIESPLRLHRHRGWPFPALSVRFQFFPMPSSSCRVPAHGWRRSSS